MEVTTTAVADWSEQIKTALERAAPRHVAKNGFLLKIGDGEKMIF
jgi:hypothetical protein